VLEPLTFRRALPRTFLLTFRRTFLRAFRIAIVFTLLVAAPTRASEPADAAAAYQLHCASCHGERRYGGYAPPLLPEMLAKRGDTAVAAVIRGGLPATQMPAFRDVLDEATTLGLVELLREPVGPITWGKEEIARSRLEYSAGPDRMPPEVRRENTILVVERDAGRIVVLDGDSLRELDRFDAGKIHGGPKFDAAFTKVVAATRDGTAVLYDLARGRPIARIKVAVNTRNLAISADGERIVVANQLPPSLVVLDGALRPLATLPLDGQPSGVYALPGEDRFVLTLRDAPKMLFFTTDDLALRSVAVPEPFEDFTFVPGSRRLVASSRGGKRLVLWDLERGAELGSLETAGLPHLFSACFFTREGIPYAAFNHMGEARLSIVRLDRFEVVKEIGLRGAGYFARTHPGTPFLWIDTNTEALQLVRKDTLELVEQPLVPTPGKVAMHTEFTKSGDRALVSVWHTDGAVVAYDSQSLAELARLPFAMPVGKYNAWNKTHLEP
jgi:mono/diheme cytochrome c family protein